MNGVIDICLSIFSIITVQSGLLYFILDTAFGNIVFCPI